MCGHVWACNDKAENELRKKIWNSFRSDDVKNCNRQEKLQHWTRSWSKLLQVFVETKNSVFSLHVPLQEFSNYFIHEFTSERFERAQLKSTRGIFRDEIFYNCSSAMSEIGSRVDSCQQATNVLWLTIWFIVRSWFTLRAVNNWNCKSFGLEPAIIYKDKS